ncbi:MAG: FtsQ-type POTRA domain-containing protein [Opitutaceae bacterium]|nr:FtsQ-type POTRA domain-containing protein [Opitutaceae bacterium]
MKPQLPEIPASRTWRDIAQPVRPGAMSRGGRWRLALALTRTAAVGALLGAVGWGVWTVTSAVSSEPRAVPAAAKAVAMRPPELRTDRDGVLDAEWLGRTLALPKGVTLMELNLDRLRARLLADLQVRTATLTRQFPDRLQVKITERSPMARLRAEVGGEQRDLLVARDGAAYFGTGYDAAGLATLPWIDGVALAREGLGFRITADVEPLARLLADAQFAAPHLYREWHSVSLSRLAADRAMEVTMKSGVVVAFSAQGGYFLQLAYLDYFASRIADLPFPSPRIDLTLGRDVPIAIQPAPSVGVRLRAPQTGTALLYSVLSPSHSSLPSKREL